MNTIDRLSRNSSFGEHRTDDSDADASHFTHRRVYHARSITPASFYADLATAPPRPEDFLVYESPRPPEPVLEPRPSDLSRQYRAQPVALVDPLPGPDVLLAAGELPVYDAKGTPSAFKSLYRGPQASGARQLVVLIRHVFCHSCQNFVRSLAEAVARRDRHDPESCSVVLISCSSYKLIEAYRKYTSANFRIFADPSRKLFKALGCRSWAFSFGARPQYDFRHNRFETLFLSLRDYSKSMPNNGLHGGSLFQVGGEFLFENGDLVWCHRMRNIRDHAEVSTIERVLGVEDSMTERDADEASLSQQSCLYMPTQYELHRISEALESATLRGSTLGGSTLHGGVSPMEPKRRRSSAELQVP